jgi:uracil-DNA glycosylase
MRKGFFSSLPVLQTTSSIPKCGLCQLYKTCKSPKMPVSGKGKKKILIIAQSPGKDEDLLGKQLIGNSGRDLERILRKYGINMREDCWLENSLRCRPPNDEITNRKMIEWCRPNVSNTVKELKPEIVILLGASAIESYLGMYWFHDKDWSPSRWGGYQIPLIETNTWVCPTYHPAALLHSKDKVMELIFNRHLEAASKLKGRPYGKSGSALPNYESHIEIIHKWDTMKMSIPWMKIGDTIAFDFETNMLKPYVPEAKIYTCSICLGENLKTIAFPMVGRFIGYVQEILRDKSIKKVGTNQSFEHQWALAKLGVEVKGWSIDTMLTAHGLENATEANRTKKKPGEAEGAAGRKITSIKFQAFVKLGVPAWDQEVKQYLTTDKKSSGYTMNRIKDCPPEALLRYNAFDSLYEFLVSQKQRSQIEANLS